MKNEKKENSKVNIEENSKKKSDKNFNNSNSLNNTPAIYNEKFIN